MTEFHLLRPWWLLGLFSIVLIIYQLQRTSLRKNNWKNVCDAHLLPHLLQPRRNIFNRLSLILPSVAIIIACFSLAGPSWSKLSQSLYTAQTPVVIALDLSDAMLAQDLKPSRLSRAKFKLHDILTSSTQNQFGLVVFAAEPFTVSPLTLDAATINSMVPELENNIIPVQGSNISAALEQAVNLIKQADYQRGKILLITASQPTDDDYYTARQLAGTGFTVSVMAIGDQQAKFNGNNKLFKLDTDGLRKLAQLGSGQYFTFSDDNRDIEQVRDYLKKSPESKFKKTAMHAEQWQDNGRYLMLLLLPLALVAFRRGWLENLN